MRFGCGMGGIVLARGTESLGVWIVEDEFEPRGEGPAEVFEAIGG